MVAELLVDRAVGEGRRLLTHLHRTGFDVTAAAWLHSTDTDRWYLYLVSKEADGGLGDALGRLYEVIDSQRLADVTYNTVRLVRPDEPVGQLLTATDEYWAGNWVRTNIRHRSIRLEVLGFDEALLYPPAGRMTPADVAHAVADILGSGLMDRVHNRARASVTVERGGGAATIQPTGMRLDPASRKLMIEFENPIGSGVTNTVPADEITDIYVQ